jgi:hypothetical protein
MSRVSKGLHVNGDQNTNALGDFSVERFEMSPVCRFWDKIGPSIAEAQVPSFT